MKPIQHPAVLVALLCLATSCDQSSMGDRLSESAKKIRARSAEVLAVVGDKKITAKYVNVHLKIGIDSLKQLMNNGLTVRHLKF